MVLKRQSASQEAVFIVLIKMSAAVSGWVIFLSLVLVFLETSRVFHSNIVLLFFPMIKKILTI